MNRLNKSLFAILMALLIVSCVGSVLASSDDDGSGSIKQVDDDSIEDSDEVISVSDDSQSDDSGYDDSHISLSRHSTGNPLILLLGALAIGISARRL